MRAAGGQRCLQVPQRMFVQFRAVEAFLPGESAAQHVGDGDDVAAAGLGDCQQFVGQAHLTNTAYRMDGNGCVNRR